MTSDHPCRSVEASMWTNCAWIGCFVCKRMTSKRSPATPAGATPLTRYLRYRGFDWGAAKGPAPDALA